MPLRTLQAHLAGPPADDPLDLRGDHDQRAATSRCSSRRSAAPAATTPAASPSAIAAAARSGTTASSTSSATSPACPARLATIEYDPNRSARIGLLHYRDGEKRYMLLPHGLKVGDVVVAGPDAEARVGNALPLANIPLGTTIHNIELVPGKGGQIVRSAGAAAQLLAKEGDYATVRLPSGEVRRVRMRCMATVGQVSNLDHENQNLGKAGRARHMGQRPEVRGVVMNPRDHPHGGGEGKSPTGMPPKTPWGKPAMGYRTRRAKTTGRLIVRSRHRK